MKGGYFRFGVIVIEYLISYEHMGIFDISVYNSIPNNNNNHNNDNSKKITNCKDYFRSKPIAQKQIDTLRRKKISIAETTNLKLNFTINSSNSNNYNYQNKYFICISIIKANDNRRENKISLFSFTFF